MTAGAVKTEERLIVPVLCQALGLQGGGISLYAPQESINISPLYVAGK